MHAATILQRQSQDRHLLAQTGGTHWLSEASKEAAGPLPTQPPGAARIPVTVEYRLDAARRQLSMAWEVDATSALPGVPDGKGWVALGVLREI